MPRNTLTTDKIVKTAMDALEELKALDVTLLDVHALTSVTDYMIIASGSSNRQIKALADNVIEQAKQNGIQPLGVEGQQEAEWILVDLGDVLVHIMHPTTRAYYQLEKLWSADSRQASSSTQ